MAYTKKIIRDALDHPVTPKLDPLRQARRAENIDYANGDINFIGDCCFANSGIVNVSGNTTLIEFNSGPSYLKTETQAGSDGGNGDDFYFYVYLNDVILMKAYIFQYSNSTFMGFTPYKLIIPPFTKVTFAMENVNSAQDWALMLTGKVYAGAEIIQGAI